MPESNGHPNQKSSQLSPDAPTGTRISQACLLCRRKKVKCDGHVPCHNCTSRDVTCEYPGSNDNASTSRQYAQAFEDRCQQLDRLCSKLETVSQELSQSLASVEQLKKSSQSENLSPEAALREAAHTLQSLPGPAETWPIDRDAVTEKENVGNHEPGFEQLSHIEITQSEDSHSEDDEIVNLQDLVVRRPGGLGSLVTDSYGRLRFLGGAMNRVLVEAVQSLSPAGQSSASTFNGLGESPHTSPTTDLELPLFVHGQKWPELPHMPRLEHFARPPQYIADLLVGLYFDQLHFTFPVLYKPQFMARYREMISSRTSSPPDRKFLSVFYAICACASSLLPFDSRSNTFPGLEYYQKSLLLFYSSTGEATIERVQCLALLAMCSGGWNTMTQSWTFAGQAVRAAQDLGMHLSDLDGDPSNTAERVKQQLSRRIWWSVYCLDRITSICLGRPMAAHDEDCHCQLPLSVDDDELEDFCSNTQTMVDKFPASSSSLGGFLEFAQLCQIGGRIQRLHSPSSILRRQEPRIAKRMLRSVASLQKSLDEWLGSLPDEIHLSEGIAERGPNLTMRVVMFIVHAGSLLNLYRSLSIHSPHQGIGLGGSNNSISHCVDAARSCINAAEFVRELVPPSHNLAICVYYLILSGIILLRMPEYPSEQAIPDVKKCIRFLEDLEMTWSGARKGRAILESLLKDPTQGTKRSREEFEAQPDFLNTQIPGLDLFGYEVFNTDLFNSYLV